MQEFQPPGGFPSRGDSTSALSGQNLDQKHKGTGFIDVWSPIDSPQSTFRGLAK